MDQLDKIYAKMEDKMLKDAFSRNVFIKKSINDYIEAYKNAFSESKNN